MRNFMKSMLSFLLISFFSSVQAASANETLAQLLNHIRTMQASFSNEVRDTHGKIINRSQGKMTLERPGKFRWDVIQPNRQLIVTNGKKIWIYDVDLEQLTIRYLGKEGGEAPALLLSNTNETLAKDFQVKNVSDSNTQWFLLIPKDKSSLFESIRLGFQHQQMSQMQLQDHLGHVTMIQFHHVVVNASVSPSLFNFRAPAHVDVIDETKQ